MRIIYTKSNVYKITIRYIIYLIVIFYFKEYKVMNKCLFCKKNLEKDCYENKVGKFCSEDHYDKYLKGLSKEEYIELQHSMCVCSDD